jgi:predicted hydrocarbon binding protein
LKGLRKREFPFYYAKGRNLFHIVAKTTDEPGSMSKILALLSPRVNFIGINAYSLEDDSAIFSAFAEGLVPDETAAKIRSLLISSEAVLDGEVMPGHDGILVDTFHTGLEAHGDEMMTIRRKAMTGMLARISGLLGSGGETVLYEEGKAIGRINTEETIRIIGRKRVIANIAYLRKWLQALGWGEVSATIKKDGTHFVIRDCFECAQDRDYRTGCHFFRGYIVGSRGVQYGIDPLSKEVKCMMKGDKVCEFILSPRR